MSRKSGSDAMAAIHETMKALRDVGAVGKRTMRHFDEACLTPIRARKATGSLVSKRERGEKRPSSGSLPF